MPMPDMAAFLVFPTGSETGGQPQFMLFSFFPGGNIKHHIWWYRGTRFSDEAFHIWPWQVHAVSPVRAGASCFVSFFALAKFQIRVGENRWKQIIFKVRIACFQSSPMLQKPFGRKFWRPLGPGSLELPRWSFSEWEGRCLAPHPDASRCQGFPRIEQE